MYDPKNNHTQYSYNDNFPACGSPSGSTNAYLTDIQDAKGFTQTFTYRYCDGQLYSATDRNSQTTSYSYVDNLARLTQISYPDGGRTTYTYSNACGHPATTTIALSGSSNYTESATLDGVCHVTRNAITSDPQADYTDTTYDGSGRVWKVSNPYRSTSELSYGLTTWTYDALGRTTQVAYPDSNTMTTSYSGNSSTVTDAAGKTRTLCSDALGRLTSVTEDPSGLNYSTGYAYSIDGSNDKVMQVTQGIQTRTFVYDSLSRLTSASNPESGLTSYTYPTVNGSGACSGDPSSPCTRTDARSITTTYAYNDPLNRLTGKTYNDNPQTPSVSFSYDESTVTLGSWTSPTLAYPNGRLTHTTTMSGSTLLTATVQDYEKMARTQNYWQCTPYNCGSASIWHSYYHYDLAGDNDWWTHPAGFTITNTISPARRITQISSSMSDSTHPPILAQNLTYTPWGALSSLQNGCAGSGCTQVLETYDYNNRLQPVRIQLGTATNNPANYCLVYNYYSGLGNPSSCAVPSQATTGNNGSVMGYWYQDNWNSSFSHTATYGYDNVNRLTSAVAAGSSTYNLTYTYTADGSNGQYGNMSCVTNAQTNGPCPNWTFNAATNRISTPGWSYDVAGEVTSDAIHADQWDAEGRMKSVDNVNQTLPCPSYAAACMTFNALGQRVEMQLPSAGGWRYEYLYDPWGHEHGSYDGAGNTWGERNILLGQRQIAVYYGGYTRLLHPNHLGSTLQVSYGTGANAQDELYYPWGQQWRQAGTAEDLHFAGFEQHEYLDFYPTLNRRYNSTHGRWLTPDPGGMKVVHLDDPQTWNMYAYVRNNPTTLTDPSGLDIWLRGCGKETDTCHQNYVGTWTKDHSDFTRTHLSGDLTGSATLGTNGISVSYKGHTYAGVWDTNKGENAAVYVAGAGALKGYTAQITGACANNSCLASGTLYQQANSPQYRNPSAAVSSSLSFDLRNKGSGFVLNPGLDRIDPWHRGQLNFRGFTTGQPLGLPSTHVTPDISPQDDSWVEFHVDARYPYEDPSGFIEHAGSAVESTLP